MALDEPNEDEKPVEVNGIGLLINESAAPLIEDATVDYIKDEYREGFIITSSGSCEGGCSSC